MLMKNLMTKFQLKNVIFNVVNNIIIVLARPINDFGILFASIVYFENHKA